MRISVALNAPLLRISGWYDSPRAHRHKQQARG